jgi:hypothetical protein
MRSATILVFVIGLVALNGCTPSKPKPSEWPKTGSETIVNLSPTKLVEVAQQALAAPPLSLSVEKVENGVVFTGWKEYRGELHLVRYWYERTRYRITISPEFGDPNKSRITVEDQTEEKATESQPWYQAPQTRRPERSQEVLSAILGQAGKV